MCEGRVRAASGRKRRLHGGDIDDPPGRSSDQWLASRGLLPWSGAARL